jgi:hypothetical protein
MNILSLNDKEIIELNKSAISENLTGSPSIVNLYIKSNNTSADLIVNITDKVVDVCFINNLPVPNNTKYQCDLRGGVFLKGLTSSSLTRTVFPNLTL